MAGPSVVDRKAAVISFRRSTVVRIGVGAGVLAALAVGFAVWVGHQLIATLNGDQQGGHGSGDDPDVVPTRWDEGGLPGEPAPAPTVAACKPGGEPQVRPTSIDIGCDGHISMSNVTWSSWGTSTASGSGTVDSEQLSTELRHRKWR